MKPETAATKSKNFFENLIAVVNECLRLAEARDTAHLLRSNKVHLDDEHASGGTKNRSCPGSCVKLLIPIACYPNFSRWCFLVITCLLKLRLVILSFTH